MFLSFLVSEVQIISVIFFFNSVEPTEPRSKSNEFVISNENKDKKWGEEGKMWVTYSASNSFYFCSF